MIALNLELSVNEINQNTEERKIVLLNNQKGSFSIKPEEQYEYELKTSRQFAADNVELNCIFNLG